VTDGGMNITPSLTQKVDIVQNAAEVFRQFGVDPVKVAVLAAVETVNADMPGTIDGSALAKMADRGQIKGVLVDGPLALDNAVSVEAAKHKGIISPVAGKADILLVPNIEVGNVLGKSLVYMAGGKIAGLVVGASRPVVVTSRADTPESKVISIAMASLCSRHDRR